MGWSWRYHWWQALPVSTTWSPEPVNYANKKIDWNIPELFLMPSTQESLRRLSTKTTRLSTSPCQRLALVSHQNCWTPEMHGPLAMTASGKRSQNLVGCSTRTSRNTKMKPPQMSSKLALRLRFRRKLLDSDSWHDKLEGAIQIARRYSHVATVVYLSSKRLLNTMHHETNNLVLWAS